MVVINQSWNITCCTYFSRCLLVINISTNIFINKQQGGFGILLTQSAGIGMLKNYTHFKHLKSYFFRFSLKKKPFLSSTSAEESAVIPRGEQGPGTGPGAPLPGTSQRHKTRSCRRCPPRLGGQLCFAQGTGGGDLQRPLPNWTSPDVYNSKHSADRTRNW